VIAWQAIERHPVVQETLAKCIAGQPDRSIREAKRLINVWQLYQRLLDTTEPVVEPAKMITRSQNLIFVADIITQWPALQGALKRMVNGKRGLQVVASSVCDDQEWQDALCELGIDGAADGKAVAGLRDLLRSCDGEAIADLASRLL
jgi:hypothetical protein